MPISVPYFEILPACLLTSCHKYDGHLDIIGKVMSSSYSESFLHVTCFLQCGGERSASVPLPGQQRERLLVAGTPGRGGCGRRLQRRRRPWHDAVLLRAHDGGRGCAYFGHARSARQKRLAGRSHGARPHFNPFCTNLT